MGPAGHGSPRAEPDRPDRSSASVGLAKLGSTRGITRAAGNLGRARGTAGCAGPDLGLTGSRSAAGRTARGCADVGITPATGRRPSSFRASAKLGCTGARGCSTASPSRRTGTGMERGARRRTVMGRAAAACTSRAAPARAPARAAGRSAYRGALMERRTSGSSRAGVGNARRLASIAHTDGSVVEPSGSCLERTCAARLGTGGTLIQ